MKYDGDILEDYLEDNMDGMKNAFNEGNKIARLLLLLEQGIAYEPASESVGISESTFFKWKRGEIPARITDGMSDEETKAAKVQFLQAIKKAESRAEIKYATILQDAAPANWQAAAWWLERRLPERYRAQVKVENVDAERIEQLDDKINRLLDPNSIQVEEHDSSQRGA